MPALKAVQHIKRLRGGSQAQLVRADDGGYYVAKFQENPQHRRVLANEFLACRLARLVGLPAPAVEVIQFSEWLIEHSGDMRFQIAGERRAPAPGLHLGVRYTHDAYDYLPEPEFAKLREYDRRAFAGVLAFDKWTCNADSRQAIFTRPPRCRQFRTTFIDFGYCFNAGEWTFPDAALRGTYAWNVVYSHVRGWEDFAPWLPAIERLTLGDLRGAALGIPQEWYGEPEDLERLLLSLHQRRGLVRELVTAFRTASRNPFPAWGSSPICTSTAAVAAELRM